MKVLRVALGFALLFSVQAHAQDIQGLRGNCSEDSHTAEGPIGSDLTKRTSRFFCDAVAITFFDKNDRHVLVQFAEMEAHHNPTLGYEGVMEKNGIMMDLDSIHFSPDKPTTVSDGSCEFFFKNKAMTDIVCGAKVDETGRRTTAIVTFHVDPGQ